MVVVRDVVVFFDFCDDVWVAGHGDPKVKKQNILLKYFCFQDIVRLVGRFGDGDGGLHGGREAPPLGACVQGKFDINMRDKMYLNYLCFTVGPVISSPLFA